MIKRILVAALLAMALGNAANSQQSPPKGEQAEKIESLVNKAAALVEKQGKAAFSEFRQRGNEWWSGDVYVFAYAPDGTVILNPATAAEARKN
jgi:cytochrome c